MKSNRLEELREEKNITRKEIAKILNVSPSIYCRWEKNKDSIPTKRLIDLANYYQINIDYILNLTNKRVIIKGTKIQITFFIASIPSKV